MLYYIVSHCSNSQKYKKTIMKHQQNHLFYVDELLHTELVLKFMVQKYLEKAIAVKKNGVWIGMDYFRNILETNLLVIHGAYF